ncbi:MAG TPA: P1 family peptidase [Azospirillaceae bacterium]|nr:P1 family peptidase [Azospirillaceae bacterium]
MIRPGPRNLITDVPGLRIGCAEDTRAWTGVTVVLPDAPAVAAADVRGGGPGTRETDALRPESLVERVDAVVLSGGSAFGLDAAQGVVQWLAARGRGFRVGGATVPIVPAAILFDLANGGDKGWGAEPPYRRLGAAACDAAGLEFALGNSGAGYGAKAHELKGGLGSASAVMPTGSFLDGIVVGALVAANPVGSVVVPGTGTFWAWLLEQDHELGGQIPPAGPVALDPPAPPASAASPGANTTLGVVATDADLTRAEALRIAIMAQDGYARAIRPVHTPFDGDSVFVLSTGRRPLPEDRAAAVAALGSVAADCVARAVARGVYEAETLGRFPAYRARFARS